MAGSGCASEKSYTRQGVSARSSSTAILLAEVQVDQGQHQRHVGQLRVVPERAGEELPGLDETATAVVGAPQAGVEPEAYRGPPILWRRWAPMRRESSMTRVSRR